MMKSNFIQNMFSRNTVNPILQELAKRIPDMSAHSFSVGYDGEKNEGELGDTKDYYPVHELLTARSWQSFLDSDITQNIVKKFQLWVIGNGLKLQAEPNELILKHAGINLDPETFSQFVEANWKLHTDSKFSVHDKTMNLHVLASEALKASEVGGDCLIVLRYNEETGLSAELIDGMHVRNPLEARTHNEIENRGNILNYGVEMKPSGEHVAYYVHVGDEDAKRVVVKKQGRTSAFIVVGLRYRSMNKRGIPLISAVLETLKNLERYKEATVGSAEEVAKIAYYVSHQEGSSGENPFGDTLGRGLGFKTDPNTGIIDINIEERIQETTGKQSINLPTGADLKTLSTENDLYFKEFYETNFNIVCGCIGIPPEVAADKYDSNFSSARAALKSWEHVLNVKRKNFADQFYRPFYEFWLEMSAMEGTIQAPEYFSKSSKNRMVKLAYLQARFVGVNIPHIDPLKEVMAERAKLGNSTMPLTTLEAATEAIGGGDYRSNISQFIKEQEMTKDLNPVPEKTGATEEEKKKKKKIED